MMMRPVIAPATCAPVFVRVTRSTTGASGGNLRVRVLDPAPPPLTLSSALVLDAGDSAARTASPAAVTLFHSGLLRVVHPVSGRTQPPSPPGLFRLSRPPPPRPPETRAPTPRHTSRGGGGVFLGSNTRAGTLDSDLTLRRLLPPPPPTHPTRPLPTTRWAQVQITTSLTDDGSTTKKMAIYKLEEALQLIQSK